MRLDANRAGKNSYLAIGCIPQGTGYTIVDGPPRIVEGQPIWSATSLDFKDVKVEAPFSYSSKPSLWKVEFDVEPIPDLDHMHSYLHRLRFAQPGSKKVEFGFSTREGKLLGLLDCNAAVVFDPPHIVLWTLKDDMKYILAEGDFPVLWPRDLSKPERFAPTAVFEKDRVKFKWRMRTPQDLNPEEHRPDGAPKQK